MRKILLILLLGAALAGCKTTGADSSGAGLESTGNARLDALNSYLQCVQANAEGAIGASTDMDVITAGVATAQEACNGEFVSYVSRSEREIKAKYRWNKLRPEVKKEYRAHVKERIHTNLSLAYGVRNDVLPAGGE